MSAFNLTPKRIQALAFIKAHPSCLVGAVAQEILAGSRSGKRGLWSQQATRAGAGYCKQLEAQGLVHIDRYVDCGFGEVRISVKGDAVLKECASTAEDMSLDAVLGRCMQ